MLLKSLLIYLYVLSFIFTLKRLIKKVLFYLLLVKGSNKVSVKVWFKGNPYYITLLFIKVTVSFLSGVYYLKKL